MANRAHSNHGVDRSDENRPSGSGMYRQTESSIIISVGSPSRFGGIKGALRIPFLSFQYLRRPGRTAKLLCFHTAGGFESHRLHQLTLFENSMSSADMIETSTNKMPQRPWRLHSPNG